ARAPARRVHPAGEPEGQGLPRRLGLPEAQRPGARDDPLQGSVPVPRRAGRAAHPLLLATFAPSGAVEPGTTGRRFEASTHHRKGRAAKVDTACSGVLRLKTLSLSLPAHPSGLTA